MIFQGISIFLWFLAVPFLLGILLMGVFHRENAGICMTFSVGYMFMLTIFLIICFPMILLRLAFHTMFYTVAGVYLLLVVLSVILYGKLLWKMIMDLFVSVRSFSWTIYAALGMIAVQCYFYIFYKVENADDAYYVAAASTALVYDSMYTVSPYTGVAVSLFNERYACSPYPMFQAFMAKATHLPAAVIAHTVLPPVLVCLAYAIFASLGQILFAGDGKDAENSPETQKLTGLFLIFLSWIHITSYYCMKNTGSILLIRVWQGKATLGAVILPFLFFICYRMALYKEDKGNVIFLLSGSCAAVLSSSMGVALAPVMLGIFALLYGILKKNLRYFLLMVLGTAPCILMGLCNLGMRFIQN